MDTKGTTIISQDWFTITERGSDAGGQLYGLDHPLRFDVYRSSTGDGSTVMEDTETFAKAMPIAHVVHHVGIEVGVLQVQFFVLMLINSYSRQNLYLTHEIDGLTPESGKQRPHLNLRAGSILTI